MGKPKRKKVRRRAFKGQNVTEMGTAPLSTMSYSV
jgi:hypothetical protein